MTGPLSGYRSLRGRPSIIASAALFVGENAAPGSEVGTLSALPEGWAPSLADSAGGMFALDGRRILVGATPLDYGARPTPKLLIAASDGKSAEASLLTIEVRRPLPALPLPTGARLAAIGDSQIAYNNTFGNAVAAANKAAYSTGYGFIEQAQAHDQRFRFDNWYDPADPRGLNYAGANQGLHGDHLEWAQAGYGGGILGRLPALLRRRPDILIIEGGVNTISSGDEGRAGTADYVIAKLDRALRFARAAGIWTIPMTIYPRGDWLRSNASGMAAIEEANAWIRAQAGRDGVLGVLDADPLLKPNGVIDQTMFKSDQVHLSPKGALALGRLRLLPILQSAIVAGSSFEKNPAIDNLLAASAYNMAGTSGVLAGGNSASGETRTGQVGTGLTVMIGRNCSVVASKEVIAGSLEQQVLAITPGGGTNGNYGELTLSGFSALEPFKANQWYQMFLEVETSGDGLTFATLQGGLRQNTTAVTNTFALTREASGDFALGDGGGARTFWLQTEPFMSDETSYDRVNMALLLTFSKTAAPFTVKARRPIIRRISDPRPLWGY